MTYRLRCPRQELNLSSHATADADADNFLADTDDAEKKTKKLEMKKQIVMDS